MKNIKTLQDLIEKRARKKAEKIVLEAFINLKDSGLLDLDASKKARIDINGDDMDSIRSAFFHSQSKLGKLMTEQLYKKILPKEIDSFVDRVERLEEEVKDLYSEVNSQNYL